MKLGLLLFVVALFWRGHAPRPGHAARGLFPASLGLPAEGRLTVVAWRSVGGGAAAECDFDRSAVRVSERHGGGVEALAGASHGDMAAAWPGLVGVALGHLWLARNALLHCPPGTWTAPLAFAREGAEVQDDGRELLVRVPTGQLAPVTTRGIGRHRIEVAAYRASQELLSDDHAPLFLAAGLAADWINVTAQRRGQRLDVVVRWFAREPNRELLVQRLAFVGEPRVPVALEADWCDPETGAHALHELFMLELASPATAAGPSVPPAEPEGEDALRAAQRAALAGTEDPWTDDPRPPGAPVIGPVRPGFADPVEAFAPYTVPLRLRDDQQRR